LWLFNYLPMTYLLSFDKSFSPTDICLTFPFSSLHCSIMYHFFFPFHSYHIHLPTTPFCPPERLPSRPIQPPNSDVYNCGSSHSGIDKDYTSQECYTVKINKTVCYVSNELAAFVFKNQIVCARTLE
jgi:hypothetical protein